MKISLNGSWKFHPIKVPENYVRNMGEPPNLPLPDSMQGYSDIPIRIPSPWNGNTWGNGRIDRAQPERRYYPDSVYYPSYPEEWDSAEMGWLRRTFVVPKEWDGKRIAVHFEAVMGHAQVYVNGRNVGEHFDGYLPFELDVTSAVVIGENTLEVGVRRLHLYDNQSEKYKKMRTPYAHGSNTQGLGGIWQDVWLVVTPKVFVQDVFVKPLLDTDTLEMDVTVCNSGCTPQRVTINGIVHVDNRQAVKSGDITACVVGQHDMLGDVAMQLTSRVLLLRPNTAVTITCKDLVKGLLDTWSPDAPNLYTVAWQIAPDDASMPKGTQMPGHTNEYNNYMHTTRFGWRQFKLDGSKMLLNGEPIRLVGDICHPFGPHIFTRAHIISWYNLVKSVGGNAVRLHAQIHPRVFLDIADEMGILVMDETAIFGSCLSLNFEDEIAWKRYEEHFDGLILRDRNHPSVFGWSFGNELFAIFLYDDAAKRDEDGMYARIFELGNRAKTLDPTRDFVTCDGDEDLRGTLPIWSKHYGHGMHELPTDIKKPIVVGENGGTYYARPSQLTEFNGDQAYESYTGRNTALGIDLYNNIRHFGDKLVYFCPSELVWFGLKQLPYGFKDFDRLPNLTDGIFFKDFEEGQPGIYIERIPPYVGTLNPGFDPSLPEYIPLDMYHGMKDALKFDPAYDDKWKVRTGEVKSMRNDLDGVTSENAKRAFSGSFVTRGKTDFESSHYEVLPQDNPITQDSAWTQINEILAKFDLDEPGSCTAPITLIEITCDADLKKLPFAAQLKLTDHPATMLKRSASHPWVDSLTAADMYFAECEDKYVMHHGICTAALENAIILLSAGDTDWSLFNNVPECAKCGAIAMYEQYNKPSGAAFVILPYEGSIFAISTIRKTADTTALYDKLLSSMGLATVEMDHHQVMNANATRKRTAQAIPVRQQQQGEHDLLLNGPVTS